jgi:Cu(I)-responsive transcriptional regulator
MNISEAARRSGLSAKTIRYYEEIGLIAPADRGDNGYRQYDTSGLEQLKFLARAREVGFDLDECRQLLALHRNSTRQSRHARELVLEKSEQLQRRIERLMAMQQMLQDMAGRCRGDEGPECAILEDLASSQGDAA